MYETVKGEPVDIYCNSFGNTAWFFMRTDVRSKAYYIQNENKLSLKTEMKLLDGIILCYGLHPSKHYHFLDEALVVFYGMLGQCPQAEHQCLSCGSQFNTTLFTFVLLPCTIILAKNRMLNFISLGGIEGIAQCFVMLKF